MKRDFSVELKTLTGALIPLGENADGTTRSATLGALAAEALVATEFVDGEKKATTGIEAMQAYELATRIYQAKGPIEVTAEEIALVKRRISGHYLQPLISGQALKMLEE